MINSHLKGKLRETPEDDRLETLREELYSYLALHAELCPNNTSQWSVTPAMGVRGHCVGFSIEPCWGTTIGTRKHHSITANTPTTFFRYCENWCLLYAPRSSPSHV